MLVTIGSACVPNQDAGHGLVARSPEGVAQSERTPKMVSDMVSGFREVKAWIHTCASRCRQLVSCHCSGVRWGSQWVTGVGKVGIAPPSTKLLDGVGWESCSGNCCGCTDPQAVGVVFSWVIPTLLHQG